MMKRLSPIVAILAMAVIFAGNFAGVNSQGDPYCDALVYDEVGVFGDGIRVENAARSLENSGADVRVRVFQTRGSAAHLEDFEKFIVRPQCRSWQATDGGMKNNLVVIMVAYDEGESAIFNGTEWEEELDSQWSRIRSDVLGPPLRDGRFVDGFVAALNEIKSVIDAGPPSAVPPVVIVNPQQPARDNSGTVKLFAGIFGFIGFAIVVGFLYWLFASHNKANERRRAAQQKARAVKQEAVSRILELKDPLTMLEVRVEGTSSKVSEYDAKALREALGKTKGTFDRASEDFYGLDGSAGNPDLPKLTVAEYNTMEASYQGVVDKLRDVNSVIKNIEDRISSLNKMITDVPTGISEAQTAIASVMEQITAIADQGYKTDASEEMIREAVSAVELANTALANREYGNATSRVNEAKEKASQAQVTAAGLAQQKTSTESAISSLELRIQIVEVAIDNGAEAFGRISSEYAESSWQSITGNGTEAENRVNWSTEAVDDAKEMSTMENQEWAQAMEVISEANAWLGEAESFMHSIHALDNSLAAARRDAPAEIEAALSDISKARGFINAHDEDVRESLEDDLRRAEEVLAGATAEMRRSNPDYLRVVKMAKEANNSADRILADARGEHEAAERLRLKAATALRDAASSVSKAREYIQDHSSDVGTTAEENLRSASQFLVEAEASTDLSTRVSFAEQADQTADRAYSQASENVRSAQRRRNESTPSIGWGYESPSPRRSSYNSGVWHSATSSRPSSRPSISTPSRRSGGFGGSSRGGGSGSIGRSSGGGGSGKW